MPRVSVRRVALRVSPLRAAYWTGQRVRVDLVDLDTDEPVAESQLRFSPETAAALEEDGSLTLVDEGLLAIERCVETAATLHCAQASLRVDDGSPRLALDGPLHGTEVEEGTLFIEGSATDARELSVFVNGSPVPLDDLGRFTAEIPTRLGLESIEIVASDRWSPPTRLVADVLAAPRFEGGVAMSGEPAVWLSEALVVRATQRALDDGVSSPLDAPEDVADLLRAVLVRTDLGALAASRFQSSGVDLRVNRVTQRSPEARLDLRPDGVDVFVRSTFVVATSGRADVGGATATLDGEISARVAAALTLDAATGAPRNLSLHLEAIDARMNDPRVGALIEQTGSTLRRTVERGANELARRIVDAQVAPVLESAWAMLRAGVAQRVDVPTPGEPLALHLRASGSPPEVTRSGVLTLPASLRIGGEGAPKKESRGLGRHARPRAEGLPPAADLAAFASLDAFNGALHVLWNMGALDVSLDELVAEASRGLVSEARLAADVPPFVRAPRPGEAGTLVLELGALSLDVAQAELRGRFGARARIAVTARLDERGGLSLALADVALDIETLERPRGLLVSGELIEDLVRSQALPMLETALDGLGLALVGAVEHEVSLGSARLHASLVARELRVAHGWLIVDAGWRFELR
ncbi:MAG: hypothetical protein KF901_18090 [Myxococcales bacterium]|nr:hypothetical protein [Myxococcales bacterium]